MTCYCDKILVVGRYENKGVYVTDFFIKITHYANKLAFTVSMGHTMIIASASPAAKPQINPSFADSLPFESRQKFERYSNMPNLKKPTCR